MVADVELGEVGGRYRGTLHVAGETWSVRQCALLFYVALWILIWYFYVALKAELLTVLRLCGSFFTSFSTQFGVYITKTVWLYFPESSTPCQLVKSSYKQALSFPLYSVTRSLSALDFSLSESLGCWADSIST